jgi:CBS domain-containing protein
MLVRDLMTIYPVSIHIHSDLRRAAEIVSLAEASDLMVVDDDRHFIGVLSEGDLIRAIMPSFDEVLEAGGTLDDAFRFFVRKGHDLASHPIEPLVIKNPIVVSPEDEVAQVATILIQKQIRRLPVVDKDLLVGTVSRSDICRAVIFSA